VTTVLSNLQPGTTYHVRLVATNADGIGASADRTFTTANAAGGPDTTAPQIVSASVSPKTFRVNRRGGAEKPVAARRIRRGTTFRYRLTEAARVVFTIQRRKGKRWVRVVPGRFAKTSKAGANSKRFSGRIGKHALKPGRYRATFVPAVGGVRGAARTLRFTIVR
jgi:hypothetical protein